MPTVTRNLKREAIEARWGLTLPALIRDFHAQGLSQADTARALGYDPAAFCVMIGRDKLDNPWRRPSVVVEYVKDTGEPFRAAVQRLAATTHITEAARVLGFASTENLRIALRSRGIDVTFQPYQRPRKPKPAAALKPITTLEVDRYLALRRAGTDAHRAAAILGRQREALWRAAQRLRPEVAAQVSRERAVERRAERQQFVAKRRLEQGRT